MKFGIHLLILNFESCFWPFEKKIRFEKCELLGNHVKNLKNAKETKTFKRKQKSSDCDIEKWRIFSERDFRKNKFWQKNNPENMQKSQPNKQFQRQASFREASNSWRKRKENRHENIEKKWFKKCRISEKNCQSRKWNRCELRYNCQGLERSWIRCQNQNKKTFFEWQTKESKIGLGKRPLKMDIRWLEKSHMVRWIKISTSEIWWKRVRVGEPKSTLNFRWNGDTNKEIWRRQCDGLVLHDLERNWIFL